MKATGITPAHAGTTHQPDLLDGPRWDHPRSRGDNRVNRICLAFLPGSPPLTRGQRAFRFRRRTANGITPAHAGTTRTGLRGGLQIEDHPRSRGDNVWGRSRGDNKSFFALFYRITGSPPLTRGQLTQMVDGHPITGITPAHAGTTPVIVAGLEPVWDHPRSRGDNYTRHKKG